MCHKRSDQSSLVHLSALSEIKMEVFVQLPLATPSGALSPRLLSEDVLKHVAISCDPISCHCDNTVVLKIDFANAFNSIHRDKVLAATSEH